MIAALFWDPLTLQMEIGLQNAMRTSLAAIVYDTASDVIYVPRLLSALYIARLQLKQ